MGVSRAQPDWEGQHSVNRRAGQGTRGEHMGIIEKYRFEARSGGGCSDSDYHLCRVTCCRHYCVVDDELDDMYPDPEHPHRRLSLLGRPGGPPTPCPFCGAVVWEFNEVDCTDQVPDAWRWACSTR